MVKVIRCVCLVEETEDKILLVQVRHREITDNKWVDKTDTHLIAPAVQTWIAQISSK